MRRRDFITLLGGTAAWPLAARAQQPTMPVVGYLAAGTPETWANVVAAFRKGLGEAGYAEGAQDTAHANWSDVLNSFLQNIHIHINKGTPHAK